MEITKKSNSNKNREILLFLFENELVIIFSLIFSDIGTMKYIHYQWLKGWIDSKKKVKSAMHLTSYYWKDIRCELCHEKYPDMITVKYRNMKLIDYHVPKGSPYVVLETYSNLDANTRIIHVLNYGGTNSVTLGRWRDANIRIADNSVSRMHSELIYYHHKFYQSDLSSKFGTLRVFRYEINWSLSLIIINRKPIKVQNTVTIQAGNTVLSFSLAEESESWWWFDFSSNEKTKINPFTFYEMVRKEVH